MAAKPLGVPASSVDFRQKCKILFRKRKKKKEGKKREKKKESSYWVMCLSLWAGERGMLIGLSQSGLTHGTGGTVNPTYTILWKNHGLVKEEVGRRNELGETIS